MHKHFFIFLFSFTFLTPICAQYAETIRTGRPGQSIGPFTTGARVFQVQSGAIFASAAANGETVQSMGGDAVLRYGLLEDFEVSALLAYTSVSGESPADARQGLQSFQAGFRYHILTGDGGFIPDLCFQYRLRFRAVHPDFRAPATGSKFIFVTRHPLTRRLALFTNNGLDWNGFDPRPQWFWTVNLPYTISDRWGVFLEAYGNVFAGDADTFVDGGLAFLVSPDLQLDLYAGGGQNDGLTEYFVNLGFSWRVRHGR